MGLGHVWGTLQELLHPRGWHGRFVTKAKMDPEIARRVSGQLDSFSPRMFASDGQAAQHLFNSAKPGRFGGGTLYGRLHADYSHVAEDLRDGKIDNPETAKFIRMMDQAAVPLPSDVIATRVLPLGAFGLDPATIQDPDHGIDRFQGTLIADKMYGAASLGHRLQGAPPGGITMIIAAPRGTKAIIPADGQNDRSLYFDRDQPLRVTKIEPDGRGGFNMYVVAEPRTSETPVGVHTGSHVGAGRLSNAERRKNIEALTQAQSARTTGNVQSDAQIQADAVAHEAARQQMLQEVAARQAPQGVPGTSPAPSAPTTTPTTPAPGAAARPESTVAPAPTAPLPEHPQSGQPSPEGPAPAAGPNVPPPRTEPTVSESVGQGVPRGGGTPAAPTPQEQTPTPAPGTPAAPETPQPPSGEPPTGTPPEIPTPETFRAATDHLAAPSAGPQRKQFNDAFLPLADIGGSNTKAGTPAHIARNLDADIEANDKELQRMRESNTPQHEIDQLATNNDRLKALSDTIHHHYQLGGRKEPKPAAPAKVAKAAKAAEPGAPEAPAPAKRAPRKRVPEFHERPIQRTPEEHQAMEDAVLRRAANMKTPRMDSPAWDEHLRILAHAERIMAKRENRPVAKWAQEGAKKGGAPRAALPEGSLRGKALDDALREAKLPRTGTADEKRKRLAEHHAKGAEAQATAAQAETAQKAIKKAIGGEAAPAAPEAPAAPVKKAAKAAVPAKATPEAPAAPEAPAEAAKKVARRTEPTGPNAGAQGAPEALGLRGKALDDALKEAGLPRTGTADEKRQRLLAHDRGELPTPAKKAVKAVTPKAGPPDTAAVADAVRKAENDNAVGALLEGKTNAQLDEISKHLGFTNPGRTKQAKQDAIREFVGPTGHLPRGEAGKGEVRALQPEAPKTGRQQADEIGAALHEAHANALKQEQVDRRAKEIGTPQAQKTADQFRQGLIHRDEVDAELARDAAAAAKKAAVRPEGAPSAPRIQRTPASVPGARPAEVTPEPTRAQAAQRSLQDLGIPEQHTVADLRAYAKEHGVDIKGKTRKADLQSAILAHERPAEVILPHRLDRKLRDVGGPANPPEVRAFTSAWRAEGEKLQPPGGAAQRSLEEIRMDIRSGKSTPREALDKLKGEREFNQGDINDLKDELRRIAAVPQGERTDEMNRRVREGAEHLKVLEGNQRAYENADSFIQRHFNEQAPISEGDLENADLSREQARTFTELRNLARQNPDEFRSAARNMGLGELEGKTPEELMDSALRALAGQELLRRGRIIPVRQGKPDVKHFLPEGSTLPPNVIGELQTKLNGNKSLRDIGTELERDARVAGPASHQRLMELTPEAERGPDWHARYDRLGREAADIQATADKLKGTTRRKMAAEPRAETKLSAPEKKQAAEAADLAGVPTSQVEGRMLDRKETARGPSEHHQATADLLKGAKDRKEAEQILDERSKTAEDLRQIGRALGLGGPQLTGRKSQVRDAIVEATGGSRADFRAIMGQEDLAKKMGAPKVEAPKPPEPPKPPTPPRGGGGGAARPNLTIVRGEGGGGPRQGRLTAVPAAPSTPAAPAPAERIRDQFPTPHMDALEKLGSDAEIRTAVEGRTKQELLDILEGSGAVHRKGDTKAKLVDAIVQHAGAKRRMEPLTRGGMRNETPPAKKATPEQQATTIERLQRASRNSPVKKATSAAPETPPAAPAPSGAGGPVKRANMDLSLGEIRGRRAAAALNRENGDEPLHLPNGGNDQGAVHLDSEIGQLWSDLATDPRLPNSQVNEIARLGEEVGRGRENLDQAAARLRALADRVGADTPVGRRILDAAKGIEGPPEKPLNLPEGTPANVRNWLERINAVPTMRRTGRVGPGHRTQSVIDEKLDLVRRAAAGEDIPNFESQLGSLPHESIDGVYPLLRHNPDLRNMETRRWLRSLQAGAPKAAAPKTGGATQAEVSQRLGNMTIKELRDLATSEGIPGAGDMRKDALIEELHKRLEGK